MQRPLLALVCTLAALALASCNELPVPPLPIGVQTLTGTLLRTDIGLLKRGTHVLQSGDIRLALVESTTVNLSAFENREVGVTGVFEPNADPGEPPVMVVSSLTPAQQDMQDLLIPSLMISCRAPQTWQIKTEKGVTSFTVADALDPVVILAFDSGITALPFGSPFTIDGRYATRKTDAATAHERVTVDLGGKFLSLRFLPASPEEARTLRPQWLTFVSSLRLLASNSSTGRVISGSGSALPCGGTAGILCPGGEYCAITDFKGNFGRCRAMR